MTRPSGLKSLAVKTAICVWIALLAMPRGIAADSAPRSTVDDPVRIAREVYQDPAYSWKRIEPRRSRTSSWLDSIYEWIYQIIKKVIMNILYWIGRLLRLFSGLSTGNWSIGLKLIGFVIVVLASILIWRTAIWIARRLSRRGLDAPASAEFGWDELAEATDLFAEARRAFDEARYAEAIRSALLALIARFEKDGLLRRDPTRTNREYQIELRGKTEFAASFGELARIHERIWYGLIPAQRGDAERAIHVCEYIIQNKGLASE